MTYETVFDAGARVFELRPILALLGMRKTQRTGTILSGHFKGMIMIVVGLGLIVVTGRDWYQSL